MIDLFFARFYFTASKIFDFHNGALCSSNEI